MPATLSQSQFIEIAAEAREGFIAFCLGDDWNEDETKSLFAAKVFGNANRDQLFAMERALLAPDAFRMYGHSASWKQPIVTAQIDFLCRTQDDISDL